MHRTASTNGIYTAQSIQVIHFMVNECKMNRLNIVDSTVLSPPPRQKQKYIRIDDDETGLQFNKLLKQRRKKTWRITEITET